MSTLADRSIVVLRTLTDHLVTLASELTDEQLALRSGATDWDVANVLSHLGSANEIGLVTHRANLAGEPNPDQAFNESVWARWNALSNRAKADAYVTHSTALVEAYEALTSDQRETLTVQLGFLPFPLPMAAILGMRVNELALHAWDIDVALDPTATIAAPVADVAVEQLRTHLGFMLGFTAKPDQLSVPATVAFDGGFLQIADEVTLPESAEPTATLEGPGEQAFRLIAGRLAEAEVTGNVTLEDLKRVFPGY